MADKEKKKPIRLEWQGGIQSNSATTDSVQVNIKGQPSAHPKAKPETPPSSKLGGNVKIRRETKGRSGHPVSILFEFTDGGAKNPGVLSQLCSDLKQKLGCGGTVEGNEVVLQTENRERVAQTLLKLGITGRVV